MIWSDGKPSPLMSAQRGVRQLSRCVFLDRDGVINKRIPGGYVTRWSEFQFRAEARDALRRLVAARLPIVVVSNQRGVARGLMTPSDVFDVMSSMVDALSEEDVPIAAWIVCPHDAEEGCCCRKPRPGMLEGASRQFGMPLDRCYMVGDSPSDIEAGEAAGCRLSILIDEEDSLGLTHAIQRIIEDCSGAQ